MAELFSGYNTYVSDSLIEHKGQQFDPATLVGVFVKKDGEEKKSVIWCSIIAIVSLIAIFSWGWKTIGGIALVGSLGYGAWMYNLIKKGQILCFVIASFKTSHTGNNDAIAVPIQDYKKAQELEAAIRKAEQICKS